MIDSHIRKIIAVAFSKQDVVRFVPSEHVCTKCNQPLDVYYAESRVYAVRCKQCEIVSVLKSSSTGTAAMSVGTVRKERNG